PYTTLFRSHPDPLLACFPLLRVLRGLLLVAATVHGREAPVVERPVTVRGQGRHQEDLALASPLREIPPPVEFSPLVHPLKEPCRLFPGHPPCKVREPSHKPIDGVV